MSHYIIAYYSYIGTSGNRNESKAKGRNPDTLVRGRCYSFSPRSSILVLLGFLLSFFGVFFRVQVVSLCCLPTMDDNGGSLDSSAASESCNIEDLGPRPASALGTGRYDRDQFPSGGSEGPNSQLRAERGSDAQVRSGRLEVRENGSIRLCSSPGPYGDRSSRTPGGVKSSSSLIGRYRGSSDLRCPLRCRVLAGVRIFSLRPLLPRISHPILV